MSAILLIDDDEGFRPVLRSVLTRHGHVVVEARNGLEAMAKVGEAAFDVAVVDIVMPEQDGFETITALRPRFPALKIIAISGGGQLSGKSYLAVATLLGADHVLAKPFTTEQLVGLIGASKCKAS